MKLFSWISTWDYTQCAEAAINETATEGCHPMRAKICNSLEVPRLLMKKFRQKVCVAIVAAMWAVLWMTIYDETFAQTFVQLLLYWFRGRLYINGVQSIIDDAVHVHCEGDEIRRDAINLSCPYAYIKSHDMMSLTLPVFIIYTNLTKKGTTLWYLLLRHSWQLCRSCWASKACGCPHGSKSKSKCKSTLPQSIESTDFAPAVDYDLMVAMEQR